MADSAGVVIVHDYLTQRGGAERVVLDMLAAFPDARVITSFYAPDRTFPEFRDVAVQTLPIDNVATLRRDPRRALPLLARAFGTHQVSDADVVLCSSSGWSHRVATRAPKVVFCHNPARWLYQPLDYLPQLPPWMLGHYVTATEQLRRSDYAAAHSARAYLATSRVVAARIQSAYGIVPGITPPARGLAPDGPQQAVHGLEPGFLLTVARPRGYKHTRVICEAMSLLPEERLVVVGGDADSTAWPLNVLQVSDLSDAQLRWLYANAGAVIAVGNEDFGLVLPEAQGFGLPAVALRAGGYLDTNVEHVTGVFVDEATPAQVRSGVGALRSLLWDRAAIRAAGERYSRASFTSRLREAVDAATSSQPVRALGLVPPLAHRPRPVQRPRPGRAATGPRIRSA